MSQGGGRDGSSIRHQLAVLRRRWPVVALLSFVACVNAAWLTSIRPEVYQAKATVLLQPETSEELLAAATGGAFSPRPSAPPGNALATEIEVMRSEVVRNAVRAKLGRDPAVDIKARGLTDVLDIRASSTVPATAATGANTFAEVYVELRRSQRVEGFVKTADLIRPQIADLDRRIAALEEPLRSFDERLANSNRQTLPQLTQQRQTIVDLITAERKALESRRDGFDDQLNRLQLLVGLGTSGVQLVSKAEVPTEPSSASPLRNGALGLVGGLALGLALAFLLEQVDDRLRRKEDLEAATGLPVLGLLPLAPHKRSREGVITLVDPTSPTAEAYRTLRTSLQFMGIDQPIRCLQITSATSAEGKTTVVTNLAAAFAQAGLRVIVVDCDFRRSQVHVRVGVDNARGFTSALLGECTLADVISTIDDEPFIAIVPAGPLPPNPSELLGSKRVSTILETLRDHCDILLLDSAPVLPVTDALVVSRHVDATLLVARSKRSTGRQVARACELLRQVEAPLIGTVLNGVVHHIGYGYGYGYIAKSYTPPPGRRSRNRSPEDRVSASNGASSDVPEPVPTDAA